MDIDSLIERLQEIKSKHGGKINVGFKNPYSPTFFSESMYVDVKYIDFQEKFDPSGKIIVVVIE